MTSGPQGGLVAGVGAVATYLSLNRQHADYLKPGMRLPLLAAGVTMLLLGAFTIIQARRRHDPSWAGADDHDHDHSGHGGPPVAWLLLLPVLTVVLIRPPALGAEAARQDQAEAPAPPQQEFDPLPAPDDGAVDLAVSEFRARAYYDDQHLVGTTVRLTGFVVQDSSLSDGYQLTRFRIICCAADAIPYQIAIQGLGSSPPPDDTWVEVTGQWVPTTDAAASSTSPREIVLDLQTQTEIPAPADPYE